MHMVCEVGVQFELIECRKKRCNLKGAHVLKEGDA